MPSVGLARPFNDSTCLCNFRDRKGPGGLVVKSEIRFGNLVLVQNGFFPVANFAGPTFD